MTYRRWFTILCAVLLVMFSVLSCGVYAAVRIVRRPDYAAQVSDPSVLIQDKAFTARNLHCDVLIYGDSTASTGLDPRVITEQTGLSACNISASRPIVDAFGSLPVDAFLEHNPAPRFLVLQFGPEIFYRASDWDHISAFAAFVMLARDLPTGLALRTFFVHAPVTLQATQVILKKELFPFKGEEAVRQSGMYSRTAAIFEQSGGFFNLENPALTSCDFKPLELYGPVDTAWISQLRRKYQARGITTLIDSAPIPDCDPQLELFQHDLAPYLDADTQTLPVGMFVFGGRHMHAAGARAATLLLSHQIEAEGKRHSKPS